MPPKVIIYAMTSLNAALTGPWLDQGPYYEIGALLSADAVMIGSDSAVAGLKGFEPSLPEEAPVGAKGADENLP